MSIFFTKAPLQHHSIHLCDCKQSSDEHSEGVSPTLLKETETEKEREAILCKNCKNEITTAEFTTAVHGKHAHIFKNPAGLTFHIGCFSKAWGCIVYGIPTSEFTWFAGFSWCVALCAHCFTHLGWYYQSGETGFFGLILANLVKDFEVH